MRSVRVAIALGFVWSGCPADPPCAAPADAAFVADAPSPSLDARLDVTLARDAPASCSGGTFLVLVPLRVVGPAESIEFSADPDREYRVRIFRYSDGAPAFDATVRGGTGAVAIGRVVPGEYQAAIDSGEFVVGAELIRPGSCSPTDPADDVYCRPVRFVVRPCEERIVSAALYCDLAVGPCPATEWPW